MILKVKSRLTLKVCKGELNKTYKQQNFSKEKWISKTQKSKQLEREYPQIDKLKEQILAETLPFNAHVIRTQLLNVIEELRVVLKANQDVFDAQQRQMDFEKIVQKAIVVLVQIHNQIFESTYDEHEELQIDAEMELSSLRSILPPVQWRDAVDEVVRDKLRQRYPSLRVGAIWDAINQT